MYYVKRIRIKRRDNSRLPTRSQMSCEEVSAGEGKRAFLRESQGLFAHRRSEWLTSHSNGRLSLSYIVRQCWPRNEYGVVGLTGKLMSFEVRQSCEFCSANVTFLRLWDSGNVPRMRLSGAGRFLWPRRTTDYVFRRRHGKSV
jgi:hypothetical protein